MRKTRSSGSVRGGDGDIPTHSAYGVTAAQSSVRKTHTEGDLPRSPRSSGSHAPIVRGDRLRVYGSASWSWRAENPRAAAVRRPAGPTAIFPSVRKDTEEKVDATARAAIDASRNVSVANE